MDWLKLLPSLGTLLDRLLPDPKAAADAKLELVRLAQSGELAQLNATTSLALAQIDVAKVDAAGQSPMQRNARPFILWVCGLALAFDTLAKPLILYGAAIAGHPLPDMPNLSSEQLYSLLFGVLGLGGFRTFEKVKGAA
ncbi:MAG: 3TM-type holin [Rhodoferax sp.]|nr:3TM-type holin [Rhodoferax sp.]